MRMRPSEGVQDVQARGKPMLEAHGQAVVVIVARRVNPGDRAEAWSGRRACTPSVPPGDIRGCLVVVAEDGQAKSVVAVVGHFDHGVFGDSRWTESTQDWM